jgi:hypothetical protein
MKTKLYLYEDAFITADTEGTLDIECGEMIINFTEEDARKITRFLNFVYGQGKDDKLDKC